MGLGGSGGESEERIFWAIPQTVLFNGYPYMMDVSSGKDDYALPGTAHIASIFARARSVYAPKRPLNAPSVSLSAESSSRLSYSLFPPHN